MKVRKLFNSCKNDVRWFIYNFAKFIKAATILDVGCGSGEYTSLFSRNENMVIGLDLENKIEEKYAKFLAIRGDATRLPFHNGSVDLVVSFDVIEHVEDDLGFLKEMRRVLKKGGRVFLSTPNRERLSHKLLRIIGIGVKYPLTLGGDCIHIREYTKEELEDLFQESGFKNIYIYPKWVGMRLRVIDIGLTKFPTWLNPVVQYWFVEAMK